MTVRVGINGFGRIGRNIMRAALGDANIDFVAVNDLTNAATLAHLLKYDSVLGNLHAKVEASGDGISVDGDAFKVLSLRDPAQLFQILYALAHVHVVRADKTLYRVKKGNYMGQNFGLITDVTESEIKLKEIVQDSAGDWAERQSVLPLLEEASKGDKK